MKNFKLANKDKRLLLTLLIGVIVVAAFFGLKNLTVDFLPVEGSVGD